MTADLRYAMRRLRKSPGFALTAILTLAVGIGGVTAVFSIVDTVLLRPLPYPQSSRLVVLHMGMQHLFDEANLSAPDVIVYQHNNHAFTGVGGFLDSGYEVSGAGAPFRAQAERVTASVFPVLGVPPFLGRPFTQQEDDTSVPVTVISYALWKNRFQANPQVIGKTIDLDRRPYTIVGVMPRDFETPSGAGSIEHHDLWVPMSFTPTEKGAVADNFDYGAVARLRPDVTMAQAQQDIQRVLALIQANDAQVHLSVKMRELKEQTVADTRPLLRTLMGAVALILLIACANLANLLLVRAAGRRREFGVRMALGAERPAMQRQLLTESLLLSSIGGAIGLALTAVLVHSAVAYLPTAAPDLPRIDEIAIRWPVAALVLLLIGVAGVLCGLAPAMAGMNTEVLAALRDGSQGTGQGRAQHRLRNALVIGETALAMLLLVGSALLLRSFARMLEVSPGFQPEHVMTASLALPQETYPTQQKADEFFSTLQQKMDALPGVQAVGFSTNIPVIGRNSSRLFAAQGYVRKPDEGFTLASNYLAAGDYFRALRIPLIEGRYFDAVDDQPGAPLVAIISQSFAKRYFAGRDPIGVGIRVGPSYQDPMPVMHVVGVVGDVSDNPLDQTQDIEMYEPVSQAAADLGPYADAIGVIGSLRVVARTAGDPALLEASFTDAVHRADPLLAITHMQTMDEVVSASKGTRRFNTGVLTAFAAVALSLALVGIYGLLTCVVAERTREIAIRMALGATRADVQLRTLRQALALGATGLALGVAASAGLTRYLASLLYGVQPLDSTATIGAATVLLACAALAGWLPARRAATVEPMQVLRSD